MVRVAITVATLFGVGAFGVWAFNPDDGALLHSEPLWTVCGIGLYVAVALMPLIGLAVVGTAAVEALRRRH